MCFTAFELCLCLLSYKCAFSVGGVRFGFVEFLTSFFEVVCLQMFFFLNSFCDMYVVVFYSFIFFRRQQKQPRF